MQEKHWCKYCSIKEGYNPDSQKDKVLQMNDGVSETENANSISS